MLQGFKGKHKHNESKRDGKAHEDTTGTNTEKSISKIKFTE